MGVRFQFIHCSPLKSRLSLPTTGLLFAYEVTLSLPTTVGSADAHRRKRQRSRGPTHHVRQAEEAY